MLKNLYRALSILVISFFFAMPSGFAQDADTALGEKLFKQNCSSCHNSTEVPLVGPGLKGIEDRRDYAWIKKWVNNPQAVIASGDEYANDLYKEYNNLAMTAYPGFGDDEIKGILAYIKQANEAPAVVAPVAGAEAGAATSEASGGSFFKSILIGLLVLIGLVLVALFYILKLVDKLSGKEKDALAEGLDVPAKSSIGSTIKSVFANKTIRVAIIWMFALIGTKAMLDGAYKIGVHQGYAPNQPIPFSHKLHAGDMEINCNYCHTGVYKGKQAGIPSPSICMNCHNTIKRESPYIQKIYTAIENDKPIEWVRVHNLPDLAYFNHSQHTNVAGLDCDNCHGDIAKMEIVEQKSSLTMGWCIDCHRKTDVNAKGNAYYDNLLEVHNAGSAETMKVEDIGGLECAKCHY